MEAEQFDRVARTVGRSPSRRRLLGGLAGLLAAFGGRVARADEIVIADASGGDENVAGIATISRREPATDPPDSDVERCEPIPADRACDGACDRTAPDGCGGRVRCRCNADETCFKGRCCPDRRYCPASNVCCDQGTICATGGGVCCPPASICIVGGVPDACCEGVGICSDGVCLGPE